MEYCLISTADGCDSTPRGDGPYGTEVTWIHRFAAGMLRRLLAIQAQQRSTPQPFAAVRLRGEGWPMMDAGG